LKIFIKMGVAEDSINFVDNNNRVIGWNAEQICCENHQCRLTSTMPTVKVHTDGAVVDDVDDMTEEEEERHRKGERIFRQTEMIEVNDVVIDFNELENVVIDLPSFNIDPDFFERIGKGVVFRLIGEGKYGSEERFVVLENYHNGYYAHGFSLSVGGLRKFGGAL